VALLRKLSWRLRAEDGFGLIELLAAMVMLNIGIIALVTAFSSGQVALRRAGKIATAASLADRQMEGYRAIKYDLIKLDSTSLASTDTTYRNDSSYGADGTYTGDADSSKNAITVTCTSPVPDYCNPSRLATGADGKSYRVDTYITENPVTSGRNVRRVTVVVRDATSLGTVLARQSSDFDQSTG